MSKRRMRFVTWCHKDPDDETKIVYTYKMKEADGKTETKYFTSDDNVSWSMLDRVRNAWVESIERVQNEFEDVWNVVIYDD